METANPSLPVAAYIDHTVLKPVTTRADTDRCCTEAIANHFAAVCIPPYAIKRTAALLGESGVKTATVIGFPMGYTATAAKLEECHLAMTDGAEELDVVINLMALKNGEWEYLQSEIAVLKSAIHARGRIIKVIVESGVLTEEELVRCCHLLGPLGIDFMKTSTGYAEKGASVEAVQIMHRELPAGVAIKASGGIRTYAFARELILAGASRIGCSASLQIMAEEKVYLNKEIHS